MKTDPSERDVVAVPNADDLQSINAVTEKIIGCAIEVHRSLGAGLLESIYENALCLEFDVAGLRYRRQAAIPVVYRGQVIGNTGWTSSLKTWSWWN